MTVLLTVSAVLFGVLAYQQLPVNDLPAVDYPVITVQVGYPGASPETMANNVATPLERQFMQINGLELVTSQSRQGFCSMTLQFALSKSIDAAATDVQTAITQAGGALPVDLPSPPTFSKNNPNDQPIMFIALTSDTVTRGKLYEIASTQVGQKISIISGVSRVMVYGSKTALRVKADPSALAARQMTMDDLARSIQQGTSYQGAGQVDGPTRTFVLQPQGQIETAEQYNNLILGTRDGVPLYLRDVATAGESVQDERTEMHFWVRGVETPKATVVMAVFRQAGSNAVEVASRVKALAPEIQAMIPPSVKIIPIHDRSQTIRNSVRDVQETLFIAFVLVVLVIYVFLGRATDTLIPVVALPMSLLLTFLVMRMLDYSLDNLSLMALTLSIGFLVDDAIVFLENTVRRMEQTGESAIVAAGKSAHQISFTILAMTLSLATVFLPLVFMSGLVGRIFREFAVTIVVSIIASGVVSLTLTPLMCARMLGRRGHGARKTLMERAFGVIERLLLRIYGATLWFFLRQRWISAMIWLACLGGTIHLLQVVPKSFLPTGDSGLMFGVLIAQEGTSPQQMRQYQDAADNAIRSHPAVNTTFSVTGISGFLPANRGFLIAFLKDRLERSPIAEVAGQLMGSVQMSVPGAMAVMVPQPVLEISTGATDRTQGDLVYTVSGLEPSEVHGAARQLMGRLMAAQGSVFQTVMSDLFTSTPQLAIDIQRDRAAMYGVSVSRIEALLRTAYSQNYVYLIKRPDDQYQVVLEVKDDARREPQDLDRLYVSSDDGKNLIPLKAVATWRTTVGPQTVNHTNQFSSVTINFTLLPGVPMGVATQLIEDAAREILPQGMRGEFQGNALIFRNTVRDITIMMILAVFVMYVILGVLYESFIHPITVLSTLPPALVGGLATLMYFNLEASLYAFIGLFMLMGIVKKNGIMIVDFAVQRVADGMSPMQAIHEASMDRFRPIIMTTLAAVMGAIPIALGYGSDGEGRRPLGLVLVGGLVVSQFITLYITPAIYLYMQSLSDLLTRRSRRVADESVEPLGAMPVVTTAGGGNGHG